MLDNFKSFLKSSVGYMMALLLMIAYILLSFMQIVPTDRSIQEIIGNGFIFYFYQIALISLFRPQGIINGKKNTKYVSTQTLHGKKVDEVSLYMDSLSIWAEKKNKENYKRVRLRILASAGLKYDDYFHEDGTVELYKVDYAKLSLRWKNRFTRREEKRRIRVYRAALRLKLSEIDATSLTSCDRAKEDMYKLSADEKEFNLWKTLKSVFFKAVPAILFGIYGFRDMGVWTWGGFAWIAFQALSGYASAIPEMLSAQSYVVDDLRMNAVKKISWLDEFLCDLKNNPNDYVETTKTNKNIKEKEDECSESPNDEIGEEETTDRI